MGKKLKWNLIVMSVLYLALGIFLLMVPGTALNVVCYALGGVVLLGAVIQLVRYFLVERGIFQSQLTPFPGKNLCLWYRVLRPKNANIKNVGKAHKQTILASFFLHILHRFCIFTLVI